MILISKLYYTPSTTNTRICSAIYLRDARFTPPGPWDLCMENLLQKMEQSSVGVRLVILAQLYISILITMQDNMIY